MGTLQPFFSNWITTSWCNTWRSFSAAPFHGRNTGLAIGRVGNQFRICWFCSLVCPSRNNPRTKPGCHPYRSSHAGCRFGRSGSSGLVGLLLRLRLSNREPVLKDRRNPDWCSYRYICRTGGFLAVNTADPNESGFLFEAIWEAEAACVRSIRTLHRNCKFHWLQLAHL